MWEFVLPQLGLAIGIMPELMHIHFLAVSKNSLCSLDFYISTAYAKRLESGITTGSSTMRYTPINFRTYRTGPGVD
jgi:hypothetical protein